MALIGKIRNNMWFVFVLLGLALLAFMMMDSSPGGGGGNHGSTTLSVNGKKYNQQEFAKIESIESSTTGLSGNALRSKVYDDLLGRSVVEEEASLLGLGVPEEEMQNLLFGFSPSPIIQNWFRNPQTGQLDYQGLQSVKTSMESGEEMNKAFLATWEEKSEQVKTMKMQDKIATMVSKGIYTPSWMAQELGKTSNLTTSFDYVQLPLSSISDADVKLTDADYKAYMAANKNLFHNKEEGRVVEYVTFDITPTVEDSLEIKEKLMVKTKAFSESKNDSLFAITNGGNFQNFYFKNTDLPEAFHNVVTDMEVGQIVGPVLNQRYYTSIKLIDKKIIPDSIEASHILRSTTTGTSVEDARAYIDSLQTLLNNGASFDSLAINNSEDPGSGAQGGELGYFTQGAMVPNFNNAIFVDGQKEGYYTVTTRFGVHLIKVTDVIYTNQTPKYQVAFINTAITPSAKTTNEVTNQALQFVADNRSVETMRSNVSKFDGLNLKASKILKRSDYNFEEFAYDDDSRKIVIWAFNKNTSVGDVSPDIFSFRDKTLNYEAKLVVPALISEVPKGTSSLADVKSSITNDVMTYKKAQMISDELKGKSLQDVASSKGVQIQNANNVTINGSVIPGIGFEPKLVASIINGQAGSTVDPIVGNNGVYLVNIGSKVPSAASGNTSFVQKNLTNQTRQGVSSLLIQAMKNNADVKDKRMDFSM